MPFYLYILMGFLLVSAGAMFYVLTRLNAIGSEQLVRVRKLVKNRKRKLNSFQHRVRLLESHMSEYMLSLGNEPARNLLDLKGILSTQATFVENIEFWLETRNLVALEESERVLQGNPPSFFEAEGLTLRARLKNPGAVDQLAAVLERKRKLFNSLFDIML